MTTYKATYDTGGSVAVYVDVPEEVMAEHTHDGEVDESAIEDWVADTSHSIGEEYLSSLAASGPVLVDMTLDGIGAEEIEKVE